MPALPPPDSVPAIECRAENLLARPGVTAKGITEAERARLLDGIVAPEGAAWPPSHVLVRARGTIQFDLGHPETILKLRLQIDADQGFDVGVSDDGVNWAEHGVEADPNASGMLLREVAVPRYPGRFVRVAARDASRLLALTEIEASCAPTGPTDALRVIPDEARFDEESEPTDESRLNAVKLGIVLIALVSVVLGKLLGKRFAKGEATARDVRTVLPAAALAVLACVAVAAYVDFGAYRAGGFAHVHDIFHYFVGAKYFPELGYDGLYECAAVAEAEAGFVQRVEARTQRDLRTDGYVTGAEALSHTKECHARFSSERWHAFTSDVRYFANRNPVRAWHSIVRDHGFNGSPVWLALARPLANHVDASDATVGRDSSMFGGLLPLWDPLLLAIAAGAAAWAFGPGVAAVAVIVFACNPLSEFSWIGGSFLREAWFTALILGLCFLRRGYGIAAGIFLALAALLQLFPAVCLAALASAAAAEWLRRRVVSPEKRRALLAAIGFVAIAVPVSHWVDGRPDTWPAFVANTEKHAATPSVNLVGLPSALSFRPSTRAEVLFKVFAVDPFAAVRAARKRNLDALRPFLIVGIAGAALLLYRVARRDLPDSDVAAVSLALVAIALETSCYYTAWLAGLALAAKVTSARVAIALLIVAGQLVVSRTVTDQDTQYACASYVLVAGAFIVLAIEAFAARRVEPQEMRQN